MAFSGGLDVSPPRLPRGLAVALDTWKTDMDWQPPPQPPALVRLAQAEVPPDSPVEPTPVEVRVSKYIPESATAVTMIVTLAPATGQALVYAPGHESQATLFKGPRSIEEVKLDGPILYMKLYGATSFDIQYTNYRQPY